MRVRPLLLAVLTGLPGCGGCGTSDPLEPGLEYVKDMIDAVRADNWLHVHGRLESVEGKAIKARIREAFYPDRDDWKTMVWERAVDVTRRMLKGLAES